MTIICLHGAYSSATNFQVQLVPLINSLGQHDSIKFKWINGGHSITAPRLFEKIFGQSPLYSFMDLASVSELDDIPSRVRNLPKGLTAEDTMRKVALHSKISGQVIGSALERILRVMENDPEIDGIMGYSEGAAIAASLILEEGSRWKKHGTPRRIKYAIFLGGWPPLSVDGDSVQWFLADECEMLIDVPTCHVIGCSDPYIDGAMALFNMCDEDTATLFDHGEGHNVPRDTTTVQELASAVKDTLRKAGIVIQENGCTTIKL
ncbi:serine hydrolase FSH [Mariannaea sp. PMI_226]|nr:serine hydrolase FSH [Mariannaea sp. PMI_226]